MNKEEIFKQVYEDFFGNSNNAKIEVKKSNKEIIENNKKESQEKQENNENRENSLNKEKVYNDLNNRIESLLVNEDSKNVLKKIIDYMKKYYNKEETKYLSFDMCLY